MAKTIKITTVLMIGLALLQAQDVSKKSVYFSPDTPYLLNISELLEQHDYYLGSDSLNAVFQGDLFYYVENDSIRCEIQLKKGEEPSFILGSFITEPVKDRNVRDSVVKFSIWMLFLNALSTILFFVRST